MSDAEDEDAKEFEAKLLEVQAEKSNLNRTPTQQERAEIVEDANRVSMRDDMDKDDQNV